jgi:hypothetical protein
LGSEPRAEAWGKVLRRSFDMASILPLRRR